MPRTGSFNEKGAPTSAPLCISSGTHVAVAVPVVVAARTVPALVLIPATETHRCYGTETGEEPTWLAGTEKIS
jgi:hypothetical protein